MSHNALKLTVYFGERRRADGGYLADALSDIYARHELRTSLIMRGIAGFGAKHRLRTDRLITLSEDLPVASVAVDTPNRVQAALADTEALDLHGLVTLERARLWSPGEEPAATRGATKLTVYLGRQERVGSAPAYRAVTELLHARGIAGATVLLGVDGTVRGRRERARFIGANAGVPLMVIAIGDDDRVAAVLPELGTMLDRPLVTLEHVGLCKRDGRVLADPPPVPAADRAGRQCWQKLMIYASEQSRHQGRPQHQALVRALREAGAAGATTIRGIWGYHGDHAPHGDTFRQLRRRVPVVTLVIDTPERIRRWYPTVDRITDQAGLVTSETVPAFRATGPGLREGGIDLAEI